MRKLNLQLIKTEGIVKIQEINTLTHINDLFDPRVCSNCNGFILITVSIRWCGCIGDYYNFYIKYQSIVGLIVVYLHAVAYPYGISM